MSHTIGSTKQATAHRRGFFRYSILLLVPALVVFAFIGKAHSFGQHRGHNFDARIERMMDKIEVSDAQRKEIRGIMDTQRPQFQALHDQMKKSRKSLKDLDPLSSAYDAEAGRLAAEVGQGTEQMVVLMASGRKQVWLLLNDEQRAEAKSLLDKHRMRKSAHAVRE